jgi:hypothetical protein
MGRHYLQIKVSLSALLTQIVFFLKLSRQVIDAIWLVDRSSSDSMAPLVNPSLAKWTQMNFGLVIDSK